MRVAVFDEKGEERYSYDTTKTRESVFPSEAERESLLEALTESVAFLDIEAVRLKSSRSNGG